MKNMNKKRELDLDEFIASVCATISDINAYHAFIQGMQTYGYSEEEIEQGFKEIGDRVGREL